MEQRWLILSDASVEAEKNMGKRFKAMYVRVKRQEEYGKERKKNVGRKI